MAGGPLWTDVEIATLRQRLADNVAPGDIAREIGRSLCSVQQKMAKLGLGIPAELARERRANFVREVVKDPVKRRQFVARQKAAWTKERRAEASERISRQNKESGSHRHILTPEAREKAREGVKKYQARRLAWLPTERREEYFYLVRDVGAKEAKRIILEDLKPKEVLAVRLHPLPKAEPKRRLSFEEQLAAVKAGARVEARLPVACNDYAFSLTGSGLAL